MGKKGNKKNSTREETSTDLLQQHPALHSLLQENLGSLEDALAEKGGDNTDDSTKKKGKKDKNATREEASTDLLQHPALHSLLQENLGSLEDAVAEKGGDNTDGSTKKKGNKKNTTREDASTDLLQHPAVQSLLKSSLVQENIGSLEDAVAEKGEKTDDTTKKKGKKDKNATREDTSSD